MPDSVKQRWTIRKRQSVAAAALLLSTSATNPADDLFAARILQAHNAERARMGQPPLTWDRDLAIAAAPWAVYLAERDLLEHSQGDDGTGENLAMGTTGAYTPEELIDGFIEEGREFRPGRFPNVSRTGSWEDVGHYTQLIWADTQLVGCAMATGRHFDVLVCRYYPAGNVMGQRVP